ncbi:MAG: topoisomerase DNA-binding C4 zinc finger domain-containing protein [Candidatus Azobacteroides sp.]|nr:topoisomerase DNA-binding C4 zinc finger domain-containing protein [Candidatus Azobacteroides sp.]
MSARTHGGKISVCLTEARAKNENAPACPNCGKPMTIRKAATGKNAGKEFWGCTGYPECKGTKECAS